MMYMPLVADNVIHCACVPGNWCLFYGSGPARIRLKEVTLTHFNLANETLNCPDRGECHSTYLAEATGDCGLINHGWAASALLDGAAIEDLP
jgi:hypothetical protein